ncbi:aminotransferase class I/II-fold pyridoxal phosphate-dependent enzyme [Mediterraneibacter sp.]|uniref:aminotransferase class I/II-fold pyridoxal phosphate-dependent enzyme n=1 Tax=Mediterraneibacter sp. TaxID=2316022 RepID=UPI0027BA61EF|nr:aminotransferase class I/II-fold pyridoxal phosphate-dependent enzyme [Mediterraneibacter sp.]
MRNPLSKKIVDIQPSGIRKFFDVANEMEDAISLGVGEPDFDTPWRIREEGMFSLEKGRTFYTSNAGLKELRKEICNYLERKIYVKYDAVHETLVTVGGSEAIDVGLRCMLDPGDEVLIPQPSYVSYLPCTIMADGIPVIIPLQEKNEFKLTVEELETYTTPKTKVLVLPFPNNPTGAIMTREDLEPIAEFVKAHDLYVMSDEIYSELTYKEEHVSIASLPGMRERTLVINGFSKGFAMTGWRLGYCCGPEMIITQMTKLHQFAIMCAPTNSQYAAVEGLRNCGDEVEEMRKSYNQRRRFLMHEFEKMGLECFEPFGAFYVFPSIKEFGMTSEEFATRLLNEEKVAVVPGTAFGECGEGFLRISYAYSLEDLKEAIGRLERFIGRLRSERK